MFCPEGQLYLSRCLLVFLSNDFNVGILQEWGIFWFSPAFSIHVQWDFLCVQNSVFCKKINETLVSLACYLISNSWQHMPQRERGTRVMSWNSLKGYNTLNSIDKYYKGNQPMWVWSIWSLFKACWSHFEANIFAMPTDHGLSGDPRGL